MCVCVCVYVYIIKFKDRNLDLFFRSSDFVANTYKEIKELFDLYFLKTLHEYRQLKYGI